MHPLAEMTWSLITSDQWSTPPIMLERSRALWGEHGYTATWMAAVAGVTTFNQLAIDAAKPAGAEMAVIQGQGPEGDARSVLGDGPRSRAIIEDTLRLVVGVLDGTMDSLESDLKVISSNYKGSAVYGFAWWASEALRQIVARTPPEQRASRIEQVRFHYEEISTPPGERT